MEIFILIVLIAFVIFYLAQKAQRSSESSDKNTTVSPVIKTDNKPNDFQKRYGKNFETFVANYYKNMGYDVIEHGKEKGKYDRGIDIIAQKENDLILIQCKYWTKKDSIDHDKVKEFYGNVHLFIEKNPQYKNKTLKSIYAIPTKASLTTAAEKVFIQNHRTFRYKEFKEEFYNFMNKSK